MQPVEVEVKTPFFGKDRFIKKWVCVEENRTYISVFENGIIKNKTLEKFNIDDYIECTKEQFLSAYQNALNNLTVNFHNIKGQRKNEFINNVSIQAGEIE